jgi:hypothetical protein
MRRDDSLHPAAAAMLVRAHDIAFGCFLYFGVMFTAAFVLNRVPTDWLVFRVGAAILSSPVVMALFVVAGLVGLLYTVRLRTPSLGGLCAATVVMVVLLYGAGRWGTLGAWIGHAFFPAYTAATLAVPLHWFVIRRRTITAA